MVDPLSQFIQDNLKIMKAQCSACKRIKHELCIFYDQNSSADCFIVLKVYALVDVDKVE